jgi:anthranilate phosphoribosyltransferase
LDPADYGFSYCQQQDLTGGEPAENKQITLDILRGAKGPKRDIVVLNAAACIHIATGKDLQTAIREAEEILDSGKAYAQLQRFVAATNQ